MNADLQYQHLMLRRAICSQVKLPEVEVRLIIWQNQGKEVRDIVHCCLKRFAKSLCGKGRMSAEKDSQWYADHHVDHVTRCVELELKNLTQLDERVWS